MKKAVYGIKLNAKLKNRYLGEALGKFEIHISRLSMETLLYSPSNFTENVLKP